MSTRVGSYLISVRAIYKIANKKHPTIKIGCEMASVRELVVGAVDRPGLQERARKRGLTPLPETIGRASISET